mmetsp:Transcript_37936/g.62723  ORF Transcript_37936/g.62723 Transcript_37936/m.62723 type:complete len:205 (+) Transcript_37936:1467-2081(+)
MPTITPFTRGLPMIDGKTERGASSPAKPAFTSAEPPSITSGWTSSSSSSLSFSFAAGCILDCAAATVASTSMLAFSKLTFAASAFSTSHAASPRILTAARLASDRSLRRWLFFFSAGAVTSCSCCTTSCFAAAFSACAAIWCCSWVDILAIASCRLVISIRAATRAARSSASSTSSSPQVASKQPRCPFAVSSASCNCEIGTGS